DEIGGRDVKAYLLAAALLAGSAFAVAGQESPPPPLKALPPPTQLPPDPPVVRKPGLLPSLEIAPPTGPAITAPATQEPAPTTPASRNESPVVVPISQAPLVVAEIIAPETANLGQPLTQEIVVRNLGKSAVHQVRVEQELPAGVRYLGGEP